MGTHLHKSASRAVAASPSRSRAAWAGSSLLTPARTFIAMPCRSSAKLRIAAASGGGVAGSRCASRYEPPAAIAKRALAAIACTATGSLPGSAWVCRDTAVRTVLYAVQARVLASLICWVVAGAVARAGGRSSAQAATAMATTASAKAAGATQPDSAPDAKDRAGDAAGSGGTTRNGSDMIVMIAPSNAFMLAATNHLAGVIGLSAWSDARALG